MTVDSTIDFSRGSNGTGSARAKESGYYSPAELQQILGKIKRDVAAKRSAAPVAETLPTPSVASTPTTTAAPAANSMLSFTTGEQIGFASQAIGAVLGNVLANRANKAQASALREQSGIYDQMSAITMRQADAQMAGAGAIARGAEMYVGQAAASAELGRSNARNLISAAAQLDLYEQFHLREAALEARRRIGQGRAGFAANGVLVDSGSAALWEQDEAADAALEQLDIMQQYEDRSWQYRTQANKAEAEGLLAAANQMGGAVSAAGQAAQAAGAAAATAGQAYALALQAESARAQAARIRNKKSWGATLGVALGAGIGSIFPGVGTIAGATAGAAIGGAAGGVYDAHRS